MALLDDILGFVDEKFRQQNEQRQKAFETFQKTGKLPAGFVSGAGGGVGPIAGQITPAAWKAMDAGSKGILRQFFDKFPDVEKAVQNVTTELRPSVVPKEKMASEGLLGSVGRMKDMFGDFYDEMKLLKSPRLPGFKPSDETIVHEMQHHINDPRVTATSPEDAGTIGLLLKDILGEHGAETGSLDQRIRELTNRGGVGADPLSNPANIKQWMQYSPQVKAQVTEAAAPFKGIPGTLPDPYKGLQVGGLSDFLNRIMMDEGLAHLSEHTVTGANPKLMDLAKKLNVGTRTPPSPSSNPLLDDVLESMRQLQGGQ